MSNSDNAPSKWNPLREEFFSERIRDEAVIQLKTINGKVAADIGAGTGFMSEGLLDAELKVIALDSSPEMIDFMKEKFADIPEFKAMLTEPDVLKLEEDSVDYAFSNMNLHFAPDPPASVKEIFRVLKPRGKAAVIDLISHDKEELIRNHQHRWPGFSFPDLYDWFINAGFKNISIEKLNQGCTCTGESGAEIKIDVFIACGEK